MMPTLDAEPFQPSCSEGGVTPVRVEYGGFTPVRVVVKPRVEELIGGHVVFMSEATDPVADPGYPACPGCFRERWGPTEQAPRTDRAWSDRWSWSDPDSADGMNLDDTDG